MKLRVAVIVLLVAMAVGSGWFYLWITFHSIPRQSDLRTTLANADVVELVEFLGGQPVKYVKLEDVDKPWTKWASLLTFRQQYWSFGSAPGDSCLIQTFLSNQRTGAFEIRSDDCVYLRKAVRWYKMPIEPGLGDVVRGLLEKRGVPVPKETRERFDEYSKQAPG